MSTILKYTKDLIQYVYKLVGNTNRKCLNKQYWSEFGINWDEQYQWFCGDRLFLMYRRYVTCECHYLNTSGKKDIMVLCIRILLSCGIKDPVLLHECRRKDTQHVPQCCKAVVFGQINCKHAVRILFGIMRKRLRFQVPSFGSRGCALPVDIIRIITRHVIESAKYAVWDVV